jgi:hypothetical protein
MSQNRVIRWIVDYQSVGQPTSQPANQSTSQPASQPASQSASLRVLKMAEGDGTVGRSNPKDKFDTMGIHQIAY